MPAFVAWELLVGFSIIGWGFVGRRALRLSSIPDRVAVDFVIGIALLGFVAAWLMLVLDVTPTEWTLLVVLGAVAAAVRSVVLVAGSLAGGWRPLWPRALVSVGSMVVVGILATGLVATRQWNPCDDDPAYLYLAKRLWSQGNLADSFNNRRLASSGLFSLLQGISIGPLREGLLYGADTFFGAMLVLFVLWRRRDGRISFVGLGITLVIVSTTALLGIVNSSPVLLPLAVMLCALDPMLWRAGRPATQNAVFLGLAFSTLTLMRPYLGLVLVATVAVYQLWLRPAGWLRRLAVFAGTAVAAALPWMVMQKRDSGSWFYPVFPGNLASNFPIEGYKSIVNGWDYFWRSLSEFASTGWPLAIGFAVVATFVLTSWTSRTQDGPSGPKDPGEPDEPDEPDEPEPGSRELRIRHSVLAVVAVLYYFLFSQSVRRSGLPSIFPRFWAPILVAAVVAVYWTYVSVRMPDRRLRRAATALCLASVGLAFVPTVGRVWSGMAYGIDAFTDARYSQVFTDARYAAAERHYDAVLADLPRGARVLSSVQLPHLLLRRDLDIQTIDIPGATSPSPEFPFGGSEAAKVSWLRAHGFDYVVLSLPDNQSCLYDASVWKTNRTRDDLYGDWAPKLIEWSTFSDSIAAKATLESGDVALVRVKDLVPSN